MRLAALVLAALLLQGCAATTELVRDVTEAPPAAPAPAPATPPAGGTSGGTQ